LRFISAFFHRLVWKFGWAGFFALVVVGKLP